MLVSEYEKCVLSVILRFSADVVPKAIAVELDDDKFDSKGPHAVIYRAMQDVIFDGGTPNVPNMCRALGSNLESVGGREYLQSLLGWLPAIGVADTSGFETWVRVVDSAGRLRQLGQVVDKYGRLYEDFDRLVEQVEDVDAFTANLLQEINKGIGSIQSSYKPISCAVEEERRRVEQERQGKVVDIIPMGWPNLERYFIPRPSTFGVIAGISAMGKTQFALQVMLGAAMHLYENNLPGCVAINELEMTSQRLTRRLACCMVGVDSTNLALGRLDALTYKKYYEMLDYIEQLPISYDDNPNLTSTKLSWEAMAMHLSSGPRIMGVSDYVELFMDEGDSEELRVSNVVRNQRRISWETGSCEIAISQYNNSVMATSNKMGGMFRTRYSGAIGQAADWFLEIYNPVQMVKSNISFALPDGYEADRAYCLIAKNKDHAVGREPFEWVPEYTRFRDVSLGMNEIYRIRKLDYGNSEDF